MGHSEGSRGRGRAVRLAVRSTLIEYDWGSARINLIVDAF